MNTKKGLYLGNGNNTNIVKERKSGNYTDYVDESFEVTISSSSGLEVVLSSVTGVSVGDILWQDQGDVVFSEIVEVDIPSNTVTVVDEISWSTDPSDEARVYTAIECVVQWKPRTGGDPSEAKQFSEGQVLFRQPKFFNMSLEFATDVSPGFEDVPLLGAASGSSGWGQFGWGLVPWGGTVRPKSIRFYIPANKQYAGILIPKMTIRSGYANWQLEGLEIIPFDIGFELGGPNSE